VYSKSDAVEYDMLRWYMDLTLASSLLFTVWPFINR